MNVALDYKPNCIVELSIELPPDRVKKEWDATAKGFQKMARIPGFRPGKAPQSTIESRYAKDIKDEVISKLLGESIEEAIQANNLDLHAIEKIDEVDMTSEKSLKIRAQVSTRPTFDLPDYKSVSIEVPRRTVTDKDVEDFLDYLREPHAAFDPVSDRALAMDDYAVVTYEGKCGDQLLSELLPKAPAQIHGRRNAWVLMNEGTLIPGFATAIAGMNIGEARTFPLDVSETFPMEELRGKQVTYSVTLHGINVKKLPEFDDALAEKIEHGSTLESLRQKIRERHQSSADYQFENAKKNIVIEKLLSLFTCDLPDSTVERETQLALKDIVSENQARGVSDEELKSHTEEILETATKGARERVRANFLLLRIAKEEKLQVNESDLYQAVFEMAQRYEVPPKKLVKDLQKNNGMNRLREQILISKAVDFIVSKATVTETAAPEVAQA